MFEAVSKCPVLKNVEITELEKLFGDINYHVRSYTKDNLILCAGDECLNLMILMKGEVRGEMIDFEGNSIKIEDIPAPRPIAPAFLFGEINKCPVTIITNCETKILFIPRGEVLKLMQKNSIILLNYLHIISSRGQFLSQKLKLLTYKSLRQRVAFFLLSQTSVSGWNRVRTQQEIADLLGVARPSLSRTLSQLEEENIISYERGKFIIHDERLLQKLLM